MRRIRRSSYLHYYLTKYKIICLWREGFERWAIAHKALPSTTLMFCERLKSIIAKKICHRREVVVAQLVERSLPIPEVYGSDPVIGKILLILNNYCILSTVY